MNLVVLATFTWCIALGLETTNWWPLATLATVCILVTAYLRLPLRALAQAALLISGSAALVVLNWWLNQGSVSPVNHMQPSFGWPFNELRHLSQAANVGVSPDAQALTLGLAIGDSSQASQQLIADMKIVSLTHLVAVSGANCAIVVGAVYMLLRKFGLRTRVFSSMAVLTFYVFLVGAQPSVLRAAVMAGAVMLSMLFGRKTNSVVILSLAATALLVADCKQATSFSFALSVAATAGILVLAPALYERLKKRLFKPIALALSVSTASQLMCFPILLQLQDGLATYSLIANLICEPLVAPITVVSLIAVSVSWFAPLSSTIFFIASWASALIALVAHFFASLPLATASWLPGTVGVFLAILLAASSAVWLKAKSASARFSAGTVALLCLTASLAGLANSAVQLARWPQQDWQIASCDVGQGDATVVRSNDKVALIDVGRFDPKIDMCLNQLGVNQIDLLVLTHFDFDHVGGLAGALNGRSVDIALLSPFEDLRPAVNKTRDTLNQAQAKTVLAERGMSGSIGKVEWSVLSPSKTAAEAEDSNDASITMLFRFEDFSLLTLADLGEKGQMRIASEKSGWLTTWVRSHDLVMKVSHHGSADQYAEFIEYLKAEVALISVGKSNGYGHPTRRTLNMLSRTSSIICRTDLLGSIGVSRSSDGFSFAASGAS
jgi:competence protein ComEC